MDKRGQFFSLFMVIITLIMCVFVVGMYFMQEKNIAVSVISPLVVFDIRDNLSVFEMREKALILDSLDNADADFNSDDFANEFKTEFISGLSDDMKIFLTSNLADVNVGGDKDTFFNNYVYNKIEMDSGRLRIVRGAIKKKFLFSVGDDKVVSFPVESSFEFEREYLVSKDEGRYKVEVVE